jgi:hypothetical protein
MSTLAVIAIVMADLDEELARRREQELSERG